MHVSAQYSMMEERGGRCHTLAAAALTWPLLCTDGLTAALQGHAHTQTLVLSVFLHIILLGVKEKKETEENQPADMAAP